MMGSIIKNISKTEDGIVFLGENKHLETFESDYLKVREKEGRIFSDKGVKKLPRLPKSHPLHKEWLHRADTQIRFCKYLSARKENSSILDLGCGNAWFSAQMKSSLPQANIFALDVNTLELQQAARVFSKNQITFYHGDIFQDIFEAASFDMIVLNSSLQYFSDFKLLMDRLLELLKKDGDIHLLDSPFYKTAQNQKEAKNRSRSYFSGMDVKEMIQHYHHHNFDDLKDFSNTILYNPNKTWNSIRQILGQKISLFPWICITKI